MRGPKSLRAKRIRDFFEEAYKKDGDRLSFTMEEFCDSCKLDRERTRDYNSAYGFLSRMRKKFTVHVSDYLSSDDYRKHVAEGMAEPDQFKELVAAAISWGIYPVYSISDDDDSGRFFHLMSLDDFREAKQRRMEAFVHEVQDTVPAFIALTREFPELLGGYSPPALPDPDGLLRQTCDICGATFISQTNLVAHHLRKHAENGCDDLHR
jgi:hypothetical protein